MSSAFCIYRSKGMVHAEKIYGKVLMNCQAVLQNIQ